MSMRSTISLAPLAVGLATAVALAAVVLISPDSVLAQDKAPAQDKVPESSCQCPNSARPDTPKPRAKPKFADSRSTLDRSDEIATLEAIQLALTEVGDGSAYVWHRRHGRLSGVIKPTSSFRDSSGKICRHIVLALSTDGYSRSTEGVACRLASGTWQLDG